MEFKGEQDRSGLGKYKGINRNIMEFKVIISLCNSLGYLELIET